MKEVSSNPHHRAFRDLMASIFIEILWIAIVWFAYLCRAILGFDPLFLFHRGGPGSAREYLWIAAGFSVLGVSLVIWFLHVWRKFYLVPRNRA